MTEANAAGVVQFWRDAGADKWFKGGPAFDADCRHRFEEDHLSAARGELADWLDDAESSLALLILLDQIPRNIYRDTRHAFATDGLARRYAREAIKAGHDAHCPAELRGFFYLPFEHSESMADQHRSVELFAALGNHEMYKFALKHREVIEKFGRFPYRNAALGRTSTPDELAWLAAGGGF
ncbi:MAG: DUF924 domain-containing protein [Xanthomonadaceae bacterium]|nr:DUF924 domain-containing protein [Xanthomonadaceae bacterium]